MVQANSRAAAHSQLLCKVFDIGVHGMTRPLAEGILALDFQRHEADRAAELNLKANEGTLTDAEEAELKAYINVGDLLAFWESRARHALRQA